MRDGLYERVVTEQLQALLAEAQDRDVRDGKLESPDSCLRLARLVAAEAERAMRVVSGDPAVQADFANALLSFMHERLDRIQIDRVAIPPRILFSVTRGPPPLRPETPLGLSTLLARPGRPDLGHEISREIASADRVDALVSFITWEGFRRLRESIEERAGRGVPLRIITTTYTGATEADAIRELARLPHTEVKVSYDGRRSRLHAKAWLFHRDSGFSTAYVGSANVSSAALGAGLEWTVKASEADLRHVVEIFRGVFDSLWDDPEFETFDPVANFERLERALAEARGSRGTAVAAFPRLYFTLKPYPFQQEILDGLEEQRQVLGRRKSLIVAATGTGKTMLAAFDYARQSPRPRLLFLAHREELLQQAREAFRHVLRTETFGGILARGSTPEDGDHLFATVQSFLSRELLERHGPDHWPYVVIDECHHLPARSYRAVMESLRPAILLGLTATPERMDDQSLLPDFDGRVAAEIRLWSAIEKQLVAPFEYYGIADGTNLADVEWTRGNYAVGDLDGIYTGNDRRADLIAEKYAHYHGGKALGFCVSVDHALFMARKFSEIGIAAMAVHGSTPPLERQAAASRLREGEVKVIFTCDLYNEGVDLPFVNTLLFLRPTASATVFLQQLGRGLRPDQGKRACLVLDFVGQHRREFRFDRLLTALTGIPRGRLQHAVEEDFPMLPSGCHLHLDPVARETILSNLRESLAGGPRRLTAELRETGDVTLAGFLERSGRSLDDVYSAGGWTALRRSAGLLPPGTEAEAALNRRFERLLHFDDPERIEVLRTFAPGRRLLMLGYQLFHEHQEVFASDTWLDRLTPELRRELAELADVLTVRSHPTRPPLLRPEWPLSLHRTYSRREVLTALGHWTGERKPESREGVLRIKEEKTEVFFVTLDKSGKQFSPTTSYDDYAVSPTRFHWQSQSTTGEDSETGRRYRDQRSNGWTFLLFVRPTIQDNFVVLGECSYVSHSGSRPMSITWQLAHPIPASLFQAYATLLAA